MKFWPEGVESLYLFGYENVQWLFEIEFIQSGYTGGSKKCKDKQIEDVMYRFNENTNNFNICTYLNIFFVKFTEIFTMNKQLQQL